MESLYKYVFLDYPTHGMEIIYQDDKSVKVFFLKEDQIDEFSKKNIWYYYPETAWQSYVTLKNAIDKLKEENGNKDEINELQNKQKGLLELLNGSQVKGLQAFNMIPVLFNYNKTK